MKKAFYIVVCILFGSSVNSQVISEMQTIEGEWYIEITNPEGVAFNKLHLAIKDSSKTAEIKQSVVEGLQKENALVVITKDSLIEQWDSLPHHSFVYCVTDDTVHFEDEGMQYFKPISVEEMLKYENCVPLFGESTVRIEDSEKDCVPFYLGRSKPSLGKFNKIDDALSIVQGQMLDTVCSEESYSFILITWSDFFAKSIECSDTVKVEDNKFSFITYPYGCGNYFGDHAGVSIHYLSKCNDYDSYYTPFIISNEDNTLPINMYPGINNADLDVIYVESLSELQLNTALSCSPNPASSYVKVEYSIVETASWKDCSIMISNNQGQAVLQTPIETPQGEVEINLPSTLAKGMYYCSVAYKGQAVKTVQLLISD